MQWIPARLPNGCQRRASPGILRRCWPTSDFTHGLCRPAGTNLAVYLAFWKEVIREGIAEHKESAIELRGIQRPRKIDETFEVRVSGGDTILKAHDIRKVVVTGVLSTSFRRGLCFP
jgi:hypothetical protein